MTDPNSPPQYSPFHKISSTGDPVAAVCFHPSMPYLATASSNGFLTLHNLKKTEPEGSASLREDLASALCLFPGGSFTHICFRPSETLKSQIVIGNGKFLVSLPLETLLIPEQDGEQEKSHAGLCIARVLFFVSIGAYTITCISEKACMLSSRRRRQGTCTPAAQTAQA